MSPRVRNAHIVVAIIIIQSLPSVCRFFREIFSFVNNGVCKPIRETKRNELCPLWKRNTAPSTSRKSMTSCQLRGVVVVVVVPPFGGDVGTCVLHRHGPQILFCSINSRTSFYFCHSFKSWHSSQCISKHASLSRQESSTVANLPSVWWHRREGITSQSAPSLTRTLSLLSWFPPASFLWWTLKIYTYPLIKFHIIAAGRTSGLNSRFVKDVRKKKRTFQRLTDEFTHLASLIYMNMM